MQHTLERAPGIVTPRGQPAPVTTPAPRTALNVPRVVWSAIGVVALLAGWQALALRTPEAIVASPAATWQALRALAESGALWNALGVTLGRLLLALGLGGALGFGLAFVAGHSPALRAALEPLRWVSMAVPTVFVAILGLLWFGLGHTQVVFLVTLIVTPVLYVNTLAGFDARDRHLMEMGRVYRLSRWQAFHAITLPGIAPHMLTGLTLAAGIGVRAVIMAELLGANDGVGHSFNRAWTFLKTPELFAWMIVSLLLMGLLEFGALRPLRRLGTALSAGGVVTLFRRKNNTVQDSVGTPFWASSDRHAAHMVPVVLSHLNKSFAGRPVLSDFSLTVRPGERIGLIGRSGTGKTTLLRLIAGLTAPDGGHIETASQRLGYVFQEPRLLPWCSAAENVALALRAAGISRPAARDLAYRWLERVGLADFAHYRPGQLSGGMQQRVALARAFAIQPDLLLLDEPLSHLDAAHRDDLLALLRDLIAATGVALVYVTHAPAELRGIADRVVRLHPETGPGGVQSPG